MSSLFEQAVLTCTFPSPNYSSLLSLPPSQLSPRELFGGTNTGINFDKYEDIPVEASGDQCPINVDSFAECNFSEIIQGNIKVGFCLPILRSCSMAKV